MQKINKAQKSPVKLEDYPIEILEAVLKILEERGE